MAMAPARLVVPLLLPTLYRRVPLPVTVLNPVIQGAVVVPVHVQSVRDAVTTTLPEPPPAPKLALGVVSVKLHGCPAALTVNGAPPVVPPPVTTVMVTVPGLASRLAGTVAVTWVALTKLVASAAPFHCAAASGPNPVPLIVSWNEAPPAAAVVGLSEVMVRGPADATVSLNAGDVLDA